MKITLTRIIGFECSHMTKLRFVKCHNSVFLNQFHFLQFTWTYGGKASAF